MCRLLGYASTSPLSVSQALGEGSFAAFTRLSELHRDGWGMAWRDADGIRRAAAPHVASDDTDYDRLSREATGTAGIVHLRWATTGLAVAAENTHPFLADGVALAHNGSISPISELDALLNPASRAALRGTTDSERYLRLVLERVGRTGSTVDGVRSAVNTLLERFRHSSMNAIILTADQLVAVHAASGASIPVTEILEPYETPADTPLDHLGCYFQLRYRVQSGVVLVASTGIAEDGWIDMPPDSLLVVDRRDLATRVVRLDPVAASPVTAL